MRPVHAAYVTALERAPVDADTRQAYASRVRQYLVWLADSDVDGDPLIDPAAIHGALRDYRAHLQKVAQRTPATINTVLAAVSDFYTRRGLGTPDVRRLDLPTAAPRALTPREATRWLRAVEQRLSPRDRVLALIPFYAGLRIGETVALNLDDVRLSARKGTIIVRAGKGDRYREVPVHPELRRNLATWLNERIDWPSAETNPALLLNQRGGRLSARGTRDILAALADDAGLDDDFTTHVYADLRVMPTSESLSLWGREIVLSESA